MTKNKGGKRKQNNNFRKDVPKVNKEDILNDNVELTSNRSNNFKGLYNNGNTCYFNAMIQMLLNCPNFIQSLKSYCCENQKLYVDHNGKIVEILLKTSDVSEVEHALINLYENPSKSMSPKLLRSCLLKDVNFNSQFGNSSQHDSHEVFLAVLNIIKEAQIRRIRGAILDYFGCRTKIDHLSEQSRAEMKRISEVCSNQTLIHQYFGISIGSFYTCTNCETCRLLLDTTFYINPKFHDVSFQLENDAKQFVKNDDDVEGDKEDGDNQLLDTANTGEKKVSKHQLKKMKRLERKAIRQEKRKGKGPQKVNELENKEVEEDLNKDLNEIEIKSNNSQTAEKDEIENENNLMDEEKDKEDDDKTIEEKDKAIKETEENDKIEEHIKAIKENDKTMEEEKDKAIKETEENNKMEEHIKAIKENDKIMEEEKEDNGNTIEDNKKIEEDNKVIKENHKTVIEEKENDKTNEKENYKAMEEEKDVNEKSIKEEYINRSINVKKDESMETSIKEDNEETFMECENNNSWIYDGDCESTGGLNDKKSKQDLCELYNIEKQADRFQYLDSSNDSKEGSKEDTKLESKKDFSRRKKSSDDGSGFNMGDLFSSLSDEEYEIVPKIHYNTPNESVQDMFEECVESEEQKTMESEENDEKLSNYVLKEASESVQDYLYTLGHDKVVFDSKTHLNNALKQFAELDSLSLSCSNCSKNTTHSYMDLLMRAPVVLPIYVNRFVSDKNISALGGTAANKNGGKKRRNDLIFVKNKTHYTFSQFINLSNQISKLSPSTNQNGQPIIYRLYGLIKHVGNRLDSGHYVSYVDLNCTNEVALNWLKHPMNIKTEIANQIKEISLTNEIDELTEINSTSNWVYFDDHLVSKVSLDHVLNQEAFMIFYYRCQ